VCVCARVIDGEESSDRRFLETTDWNYRQLIGDAGRNVTSSPRTRDLGREIKEMRLTSSMSCKPSEIPYRDGISMASYDDDSIRFSQTIEIANNSDM